MGFIRLHRFSSLGVFGIGVKGLGSRGVNLWLFFGTYMLRGVSLLLGSSRGRHHHFRVKG